MYSSISKKKFIFIFIFMVVIIVAWKSEFGQSLTFEVIQKNAQLMQKQVASHYWMMVVLYLVAYIGIIVTCIPGAGLMSIIGGYLFGVLPAVVYINSAAVVGATLFFLIMRYIVGSYLQNRYADSLKNFNARFHKEGWLFLLMLRCMPLVPFFMVNLFASLTNVSLITFLWTTSLGVIPSSIIFATAGKKLGAVTHLQDLFSYELGLAFIALVLLFTLPVFFARRYRF